VRNGLPGFQLITKILLGRFGECGKEGPLKIYSGKRAIDSSLEAIPEGGGKIML